MSIEVETVVAVSVMMAVFSAVAAVGTSIVLGAGFERLRAGFEVISKQTGFFSDAIHKLEHKMEVVDDQTGKFSRSIDVMEAKVTSVGEQANAFTGSIQSLEKKVEVVDKQSGYFGDAIHRLENKVNKVSAHEDILNEKIEQHADAGVLSVDKTEALVSHAEELLTQMGAIAEQMSEKTVTLSQETSDGEHNKVSMHGFAHYTHVPAIDADEGLRYN
ncbi:MAG: hypothetical protein COB36_01840 [Alphaproteobacteria bacterium]|nr:MAG: hypothetical protein COB36_01840 [Alphaproteobacteria bacterium]